MDKEEIRIPKYVVKVLAEKLRAFIEDNEKSFKFHPWQVTSTLNKMQKSIHSGLPERAIHHLHDTGTANEILKFSNQKEKSVKIAKVKEYLYSYLGLNTLVPRSEENGCYIVYQESQIFDSLRRSRIFEIRRLVDAIIQQLEQTSKMNKNGHFLHLNNWGTLSNPIKVPKQQSLAHCTYASCLFHKHRERTEKRKKSVKKHSKSLKPNFIKRNIKTATPKFPHIQPVQENVLPKSRLSHQNKTKLLKPKQMVETTTQTNSWSLKMPQRESLFEGEPIDISDIEQSEESDSDFYCKSDTLNDASMITEEVASEFAQHVVQEEVRPDNPLGKRRSSSSSVRNAKKDRPISLQELSMDKNYRESISSRELVTNKESISCTKNAKSEIIDNNSFNSKSRDKEPSVKMLSDSKHILKETIENNVSYSKSLTLNLEKNDAINPEAISLQESEKKISCSQSCKSEGNIKSNMNSKYDEAEIIKNTRSFQTNSVKVEENTFYSLSGEKEITENNAADLKSEKIPLSVSITLPEEHLNHEREEKHNGTKDSNLFVENIPSHIRRGSLSRCKASMHDSIVEQLEHDNSVAKQVNDTDEGYSAVLVTNTKDHQAKNGNSVNKPIKENSSNSVKHDLITFSNNSEDPDEERENDGTLAKLCSTDVFRSSSGNSLESVIVSEDETTPCPKSSSSGSVSDPESERSSIKENDNMSLEYSSHWTAEYSSTEFSESEDEEFKQKFKDYKKSLLEDDEGIAASCEDAISFTTEIHPKEITVTSGGEKDTLKERDKRNYSIITPSFDEETSCYMDTATLEDNGTSYQDQISYSINTQENNDSAVSSKKFSSSNSSRGKLQSIDFDEEEVNAEKNGMLENYEQGKEKDYHEIKVAEDNGIPQNVPGSMIINQQDALIHDYDSIHIDADEHDNDDFAKNVEQSTFVDLSRNEDSATSCEEGSFDENEQMYHERVKSNRESFNINNQEETSNDSTKNDSLSSQSGLKSKDNSLHKENSRLYGNHKENEGIYIKNSEFSENIEEPFERENFVTGPQQSNNEDSKSCEDKTYIQEQKNTTSYKHEISALHMTQGIENDSKSYESIDKTNERSDFPEIDLFKNDFIENSSEIIEDIPQTEVNYNDSELSTNIEDSEDKISNINEKSRIIVPRKENFNFNDVNAEGENRPSAHEITEKIEDNIEALENESQCMEVMEMNKDNVEALENESPDMEEMQPNKETEELGKESEMMKDTSEGEQDMNGEIIESTYTDLNKNSDTLLGESSLIMDTEQNANNAVQGKQLFNQNENPEEQRDESLQKVPIKNDDKDRIEETESEPEEETSSNPITQIVARSLEMSDDGSIKFDAVEEDAEPDDNNNSGLASSDSNNAKESFEENALSEDNEEHENKCLSDEEVQRNDTYSIYDDQSNCSEIKDFEELSDTIKDDIDNDKDISVDENIQKDKNDSLVNATYSLINKNSGANSQNKNSQDQIISKIDTETKEHSDEEVHGSNKLLKVLSLKDTQPFEDLDIMDEQLLEIVDDDGWNMLHLAASKGLHKDVQNLLRHGLSIDSRTGSNNTPLQLAIMNNHLKCCQILLKEGANLNTDEGLFDDDFLKNADDLSPEVQELLINYKNNYEKVQKLVEIFNGFRGKKILDKTFSKVILQGLADLTIDDDENVECADRKTDE